MSELDQSLSRIEKKLDNLEELLRMLLVQNVARETSTALDESPDEIPDTEKLYSEAETRRFAVSKMRKMSQYLPIMRPAERRETLVNTDSDTLDIFNNSDIY